MKNMTIGKTWMTFLMMTGFVLGTITGQAQPPESGKHHLLIEKWLKAGNFPVLLPIYDSVEDVNGDRFGYAELLKFNFLDIAGVKPEAGAGWKPKSTSGPHKCFRLFWMAGR